MMSNQVAAKLTVITGVVRIACSFKIEARSLPEDSVRVIGTKVPLLSEMSFCEVMLDVGQGVHYGSMLCETNVNL